MLSIPFSVVMEERRMGKVCLMGIFLIFALTVQEAITQDYTWDGASAAGVPSTFYRFGDDIDIVMTPEDDGSAGIILPSNFPFFENDQTLLQIAANGAFFFVGGLTSYQYSRITDDFGSDGVPTIAPYWSDVDTTENGRIYYRISRDPMDLRRISATVKDSNFGIEEFSPSYCVIATWHRVTFYAGDNTTPVNSFQGVLCTDGEHSFVVLNYGDITFTAAGANPPATVGFHSGTGSTMFLPLSGTADVVNIDEQCGPFGEGTNLYQVDGASYVTATCGNKDCETAGCFFCCVCSDGFSDNGAACSDNNECEDNNDDCHSNADCNNTEGSFTCQCQPGYTGDGRTCSDIDECVFTKTCNENAICENTEGSFLCECKPGYEGDGQTCVRLDPCLEQPCGPNGLCIDLEDDFRCSCRDGYEGYTCQASPLSSFDNTNSGFYARIRLSTPPYEDPLFLPRDFQEVLDTIMNRFGSPPVERSNILNVWKGTDGSSIVDIEVELLDTEGISEAEVMRVIMLAFPLNGQSGIVYNVDPRRVEVRITGQISEPSENSTPQPIENSQISEDSNDLNPIVIGIMGALLFITIALSIFLCIYISNIRSTSFRRNEFGPQQFYPEPNRIPPIGMPTRGRIPFGPLF